MRTLVKSVDNVVGWINSHYDLQEVDHLADAHLILKDKPGTTACGRITIHKRLFNAHPSVRRCKKCISAATKAASEAM